MTARRASLALATLVVGSAALASSPDPLTCENAGSHVAPPTAPSAVRHAPTATGLEHDVWEGATPPGLDSARPVLVFVHGVHGVAEDWWGDTVFHGHNDMYDTVYEAGYKAYFVSLRDASDLADSPIDSGELLKSQIEWIVAHAGVDRVNVVGHSKGGVDANVAAMLGAPVDSIVTLGSPHQGSALADLAQTDWLEWVSDLLGYNDAGTKFLQTGCMELFRPRADAMPRNEQTYIYTTAGTGWGPPGLDEPLRISGGYLYTICPGRENDGVVCMEQARHPLSRNALGQMDGEHRLVWDVTSSDYEINHDNIAMGHALVDFFFFWETDCYVPVFDAIEPYVGQFHGTAQARGSETPTPVRTAEPPRATTPMQQILRGGPIEQGAASTVIPVEPGVERLDLHVVLSHPGVSAVLVGPDRQIRTLAAALPWHGGLLPGAHSTGITVERPVEGDWQLHLRSEQRAGFAVIAGLTGSLDLSLTVPDGPLTEGGRLALEVTGDVASVDVDVRIRRTSTHAPRTTVAELSRSGVGMHELSLPGEGVYSVELSLTGSTLDGSPFERNHAVSVGVGGESTAGDAAALAAACQ